MMMSLFNLGLMQVENLTNNQNKNTFNKLPFVQNSSVDLDLLRVAKFMIQA